MQAKKPSAEPRKAAPKRKVAECGAGVTLAALTEAMAAADKQYKGAAEQVGAALEPLVACFADCATEPAAVLSGDVDAVAAVPK